MSKLILRSLTLTAGQRETVYEVASFFMLVSNTGALRIKIAIEDDPLSDFPIGYEYREKGDGHFNRIDFQNPNVGSVTVEYIMSTGLVRSSPSIIALDEILATLNAILLEQEGPTTPITWSSERVLDDGNVHQIMAGDLGRGSCNVQNKLSSTEKVYLGYDNTVTSVKWIAELLPGQSYSTNDYRGTIFAIAAAAGTIRVGYGAH